MPHASKSAKPCCPTCGAKQKPQGEHSESRLERTLLELADQIGRLAASNEALVESLMAGDEEDGTGSSEHL